MPSEHAQGGGWLEEPQVGRALLQLPLMGLDNGELAGDLAHQPLQVSSKGSPNDAPSVLWHTKAGLSQTQGGGKGDNQRTW